MAAFAYLIKSAKQNYALVMDADKNPLMTLPPAQRFRVMIYLSLMWTTIFCAAFGIWIWYGQILAINMLVLGVVVTGMTFELADQTRKRATKIGNTTRASSQ